MRYYYPKNEGKTYGYFFPHHRYGSVVDAMKASAAIRANGYYAPIIYHYYPVPIREAHNRARKRSLQSDHSVIDNQFIDVGMVSPEMYTQRLRRLILDDLIRQL